MVTKHTPGPWEIYEEDYDETLGYQEPKIIANALNSALVHEVATIRIGLEATPFNARLIAAAPEMLAELKIARAIYAVICAGTKRVPATVKAMDRIDAILTKVEGAE